MTAGRSEAGGAPAGGLEVALAGAGASCAILGSFVAAPGWNGALGAALGAISVAIAIVDRRRLIIPDKMNGAAFLLGLVASGLGAEAASEGIAQALARAGCMFAAFFVFRTGFRWMRGVEGMGLGDVKLAAVAGAWLDWAYLPIVIEIAALSALTAALIRRLAGHDLTITSKLPFGAFFAPAIWLCWLLSTLWQNGAATSLSTLR